MFIAFAMTLTLCALPDSTVSAEAGPSVSITTSNASIKPGQEVTIKFSYAKGNDTEGFKGFGFNVTYDHNNFEVTNQDKVTYAAAVNGGVDSTNITFAEGKVKVGKANFTTVVTEDTTDIVTVTFKAKDAAALGSYNFGMEIGATDGFARGDASATSYAVTAGTNVTVAVVNDVVITTPSDFTTTYGATDAVQTVTLSNYTTDAIGVQVSVEKDGATNSDFEISKTQSPFTVETDPVTINISAGTLETPQTVPVYIRPKTASVTTSAATGYKVKGNKTTAPTGNYYSSDFSLTVNKKQLSTLTVTVQGGGSITKTYDGNTNVITSGLNYSFDEVLGTDSSDVTVNAATLAYGTKDVGDPKSLTVASAQISGNASGNYEVAPIESLTTSATGAITAATLTVTGASATKSYDGVATGTTSVTGGTLSGVISSDNVTLGGTAVVTLGSGTVNVGTHDNQTVTGYTLSGSDAGNYSLTQPDVTLTITPADYTYAVTAAQQIKAGKNLSDINVPANGTGVVVGGTAETVNGTLTWYKDAGHATPAQDTDLNSLSVSATPVNFYWKFVAETTGVGANYTTTPKTGSVAVTVVDGDPQTVTFAPGTPTTKTYGDAAFTVSATNDKASASPAGSAVTYSVSPATVATIDSATGELTIVGAGVATITATAAAQSGVYVEGTATHTLTVSPRSLAATEVSIGNVSGTFTYNGTTHTPTVTVADTGATIAATDYEYQYEANTNAGTSAKVKVVGKRTSATEGTGNYTGTVEKTFTIDPATITAVTGLTATNKEYDGTTNITIGTSAAQFAGKLSADTLTVTATGVTADANVGTNKPVTVTLGTLGGSSAGNYTLASDAAPTDLTVNITAAPIAGTVTITSDGAGGGANGAIAAGDVLTAVTTGITPSGAIAGLTYQWKRNGTPIVGETNATYTVDANDDPNLTSITVEVTAATGGNYSGSVTSQAVVVGMISLGGSISITTAGTAVGDALTLDVTALTPGSLTLGTDYTVSWLRDGTATGVTGATYTIAQADLGKTITATLTGAGDYTGSLSAAGVSIPAVAPSVPAITATAGNAQVTVNWTAPFDGGSPITGYSLDVTTGGTAIADSPFTIAGTATSHTVTGLTNGIQYSFTLTATNAAGTSLPSTAATATPSAPAANTYAITITAGAGGTVTGTSGNYAAGATLHITATPNSGYRFVSWTRTGVGTITDVYSASTTFTVGTGAAAITASFTPVSTGGNTWDYTGNGSTSGGTVAYVPPVTTTPSTTTTTTTETTPATGTYTYAAAEDTPNTVRASVTVSGNTAAATVSASTVQQAINNAESSGKQVVLINATSSNASTTSVEVNIPKNVLQIIANSGMTLTVKTDTGAISIPTAALASIAKQAGNSGIKYAIAVSDGNSDDSDSSTGDTMTIDLSITAGGKPISSFGGASVTISIPFKPQTAQIVSNLVAQRVNADGTRTTLPCSVYDASTGTFRFATPSHSKYVITSVNAPKFTDVSSADWFIDNVNFVTSRELFGGTGNGKFDPNVPMTRAMFVTVLGRLANVDVSEYESGKWYTPYMEWAVENGIIGSADYPDQPINREGAAFAFAKFAAVTGKGMPSKAAKFTDVDDISQWALPAVSMMQATGIMQGDEEGAFNPSDSTTRAQVAAMIQRYVINVSTK